MNLQSLTLYPHFVMCHQSHSPQTESPDDTSPDAPPPRDWLDKLFSIVEPLSILSLLFGCALYLAQSLGAPIRFDQDYLWVLKGYMLLLFAAHAIIIWTCASRRIREDWPCFKRAVRWLALDRKIRSSTIRLAAIQGELQHAQDSYSGWDALGERGRELSREIVNLSGYRDALRKELARLTAEMAGLGEL